MTYFRAIVVKIKSYGLRTDKFISTKELNTENHPNFMAISFFTKVPKQFDVSSSQIFSPDDTGTTGYDKGNKTKV